jgi:hypothetical protein
MPSSESQGETAEIPMLGYLVYAGVCTACGHGDDGFYVSLPTRFTIDSEQTPQVPTTD